MISKKALFLLPLFAVACSSTDGTSGDEDDLTSLSARSRSLRFDGIVYVAPTATDADILSTVRQQTQTAFGALRTSEIGVNNRELKEVDTKTFKKRPVTVINTGVAGDAGSPMLEVRYTYKDNAVVPVAMAKKSSLPSALMSQDYRSQTERILNECTANDSEAHEFSSSLWYVFEPSLSSCKRAIADEQATIDADRGKLADPRNQIASTEVNRLYLPITVRLGADKTNKGQSYPEYQRLYAGGVQPNKLVISVVNGLIDHGEHAGGYAEDSGFGEWIDTLKEVFDGHPGGFKLIKTDPPIDVGTYTVGDKQVTGITFDDIIKWQSQRTSLRPELTASEQHDLNKQVGDRLYQKWLTFELPLKVTIGTEAPRDVGVQILTYFGSSSGIDPFKFAIKNSDVFLYNGHSYIGFGPLDPRNFSKDDFPASYQILFIDGCVSYNYYEKDYIPLKTGGTKNLDLITNGLEAPSFRSGYALGKFIATLLDGKGASYKDLLQVASPTDSLRVVDGELDNAYSPTRTPVVVTPR